jgi:hypothetical protein
LVGYGFSLGVKVGALLLGLVEKHAAEEVIADGPWEAGAVVDHQVRIDLLNLLRNEAVLELVGTVVILRLVVEDHGTKFHQGGARAAHVLDVFLEAERRRNRAELTGAGDEDLGAADGGAIEDTGDVGVVLMRRIAYADGAVFRGDAAGSFNADINVIAAGGEEGTGLVADASLLSKNAGDLGLSWG